MPEFKTFHPLVNFCYFAAVIFFTMFFTQPIFLGSSLITSIIFLIKLIDLSEIKRNLILIMIFFIVIALLNPIFVHKGATPLFFINDNPITLEASIYGIAFASMLVSVIFWFMSFNKIMDTDKTIYLFSKILPTIGLIISMALRFVPRFQRQLRKIIDFNSIGNNPYQAKGIISRIKAILKTFSILVTWAFENSIDTANIMRARGYGLKKRTTFHLYKFELRDVIFLLFIIVFFSLNVYLYFAFNLRFYYYPQLALIKLDLIHIITYLTYVLLLLSPIIVEIEEEIRWKLSISKI